MPLSSSDVDFSISSSQPFNGTKNQPNDSLCNEIPESTQKLVQQRFEEYKKNPEALNWEDYEKELNIL